MRVLRFVRPLFSMVVVVLSIASRAQSPDPGPRTDSVTSILSDTSKEASSRNGPEDPFGPTSAIEAGAGGPQTPRIRKPDFNDDIYYRNKLEFSVEGGMMWINTPFMFDYFVGGNYALSPEHYTLVPIFPSIRWHAGKISGPWFLRGNTDISATISITPIPRGPEKIYGAFDLGFRRNFVYRNWRVVPYFEGRLGAGFIDAKERPGPGYAGNPYAQGEDYTFTIISAAGFRYNFSPKYSASLSATYMHVSNAYLSEPKWDDNGINVVGPWIGFYRRLGRPKPPAHPAP